MANVVRNPRAGLEVHDSDIHLSPKQYLKLSLFAQLKKPPSLEKFPGALVVRRYRRGDELFRQGEAGWTASYILTLSDVLLMQQMRLEAATKQNEKIALQLEINRLKDEQQRRATIPADDPSLRTATVHMATLARGYAEKVGLRRMLNFTSRPVAAIKNREQQTIYVPVGGPQTMSYEAGRAPLFEGDLFGEMSCLFRTPRSATVVADRDCFMIEVLRHILEAVHRDTAYKARADTIYLKRVFELQLRKMPLFADLKKEEFEEIRNNVELVSVDPGDIVCDEHERSDCMYIVRQGLIKVTKNVSHFVSAQDVTDWVAFAKNLKQGESVPSSPAGKLWTMLSDQARLALRAPELEKVGPADRSEVLFAVNGVLKDRKMIEAAEFKTITDSESFKVLFPAPAQKKADWSDTLVRRHNRLLLEALCPVGLRQQRKHAAIETILSYCSANEYFGEMGLMLNQPRSASCIAFSHPNHEGTVELVKIPAKTFWKLIKMSPAIRDRVKQEIANRRRETIAKLARPVWEEANQVQFSPKFAELGLIQGQKLLLIDLDRCTRCDECVKACVSTHEDGHTRLFLDGPRFGKYLVPTSCRSCLDPVCMIPCPVASIHRGENKQIVIEDWCIGCGACAEACPYGSIQMEDLGLIPEAVRGWRWLPASVKGTQADWQKQGFTGASWAEGVTPFVWNRGLQDQVRDLLGGQASGADLVAQKLQFRFEFDLKGKKLRAESRFKVELMSLGSDVHVWINGIELTLDDRVKRGRHEYSIPPMPKDKPTDKSAGGTPVKPPPATQFLKPSRNVITARVAATCKNGEVLFQLRMDEVKRPMDLPQNLDESVVDEVVEKQVTYKAVVCDLCSTLPGREPACVFACPHAAAMRIDARTQFPAS